MSCPNSPGQAEKLYNEFCKAQDSPIKSIQDAIDVSPELLQMAWEEAAGESEDESLSHNLTPASFIELVHAHAASAMEKYLAWKYLQSEQVSLLRVYIPDLSLLFFGPYIPRYPRPTSFSKRSSHMAGL
jgi:hypothetical protein